MTTETETIPHSIESEQGLLGSMSWKPEIAQQFPEDFKLDWFHIPAHRIVFETLVNVAPLEFGDKYDMHNGYFSLCKERLRDKGLLEEVGGPEGLNDIWKFVDCFDNWAFYVRRMRLWWRRRKALLWSDAIRAVALDVGSEDFEEQLTMLSTPDAMKWLQEESSGEEWEAREQAWHRIIEALGTSKEQPVPGIPSGIKALDVRLKGLKAGNLVIIAGATSLGKSALSMQWIENCASVGIVSAVISYEMPADELTERAISSEAKVPIHALRSQNLTPDQWERVADTIRIKNRPILLRKQKAETMTIGRVVDTMRYLKAKYGLGAFLVDYLQLVETVRRKDSTRERDVAEISRKLKLAAVELDVMVIGCSQLNDDGKMRESRAIAHDADVILIIDEAKDSQEAAGDDYQLREISIVKQRHGKAGVMVPVRFFGQYMRFEDIK